MSAEVLVLEGSRTKESIAVGSRALIGSHPDCDVRLDGAGVAGYHAVLSRRGDGGYSLAVIDGAPAVAVNGAECREARIYHGQRIRVGEADLMFVSVHERSPKDTQALFLSEDAPGDSARERVWRSDRFNLRVREPEAPPPDGELALRGLYEIGQATTTEKSLTRLLERSAEAVRAAVKADRVVVALYEKEADRLFTGVVLRGALDRHGAKIEVPERIVRRSAVEGLSIASEVRHPGEKGPRHALSVPLTTQDAPVGAFFVERAPGAPPFHDDEHDFLGAAGRIVGIAVERTRLEEESRKRREDLDRERGRWLSVVRHLAAGILIVDGAGRVELANPTAKKILEQRLGVKVVEGLTELAGEKISDLVGRARERGSLEVVIPGEPWGVLELAHTPLPNPDGTFDGAALMVRDLTDERLREARLAQSEKLMTLGEMLAGVAHELNNPLATILGYAEHLRRSSPAEQAEGLGAILEEAERSRRIVTGLLALARSHRPERALVDAGEAATSVVSLLAHEMRRAQVTLETDLADLPVMADRWELQQVFFNLLKNAIDAVAATKKAGKVRIRGRVEDGRVRVGVSDTGPGLQLEGVLEPKTFLSSKGERGTGLGLSIANRIVRSFGGEIVVGAAEGGGASFAVVLPLADESARPEPAPPVAEPAVEDGAGPRCRVLVVDDELHVREMLAIVLRELGHVVAQAATVDEALAKIERDAAFDVLIADVRMPGLGGGDLLDRLKDQGHPLAGRLVFMSGDLATDETQRLIRESGRPLLPKPFRLVQVVKAIETVLGRVPG